MTGGDHHGGPVPAWHPSPALVESANLTQYARAVGREGDYEALWQWSVDDLEGFWGSIWEYFDVTASEPYARVLASAEMPGAAWFTGARLNYAQHVLRSGDDDRVVIRAHGEVRSAEEWTRGRLRQETAGIAAGLRRLGVGPGDRVAAYMPNIPETVAAFLATASIGAVWACTAPEFGGRAVIDRIQQIEPTVLLVVDGYRYGGRDFDRRDVVNHVHEEVGGRLVRLGYLDGSGWEPGFVDERSELAFAQVAFDHPLWVLFSSGTTGLPKAIVHGHGGMLVEQLKSGNLHLDARLEDRFFWFTTTGWMMWNLLTGILLTPASIVLYDGNPATPDLGAMWDIAERAGVTCFGASAAYFAALIKAGVEPAAGRDLSSLRAVGSTGSPMAAEAYVWIYEQLGEDTWLYSMSGGTDVCTAFVGGVATLPVRAGELQARALGVRAEAWDAEGRALVGALGELVVTAPMPSMPLYLWGDGDGSKLRATYFETYPGTWRHGDWIEITERGSAIVHGRSDSTINRGGVRMGTSEIYRAVLSLDEVVDALVVDVPRADTDGWMSLFVVLSSSAVLDDALADRVRRRVREGCSPRHVPDEVLAVSEVPRTLTGKLLEVPVKRMLMGQPVDAAVSRESLANPRALDFFIDLASRTASGTSKVLPTARNIA